MSNNAHYRLAATAGSLECKPAIFYLIFAHLTIQIVNRKFNIIIATFAKFVKSFFFAGKSARLLRC